LPVVVGKAPIPVPSVKGKNFQTTFAIIGWADPPQDLIAMRNGKTSSDNDVPKRVTEVEDEPEAIEPVEFDDDDGSEF
jgi:hypothetical protein